MKEPSRKKLNEIIHAVVVVSQKMIEVMGKDLSGFFSNNHISLLEVNKSEKFGPDSVSLLLEGKEVDIKQSLNKLKKVVQLKEAGVESNPIKSLPPNLKGYLSDMEDSIKFEKIFNYCSKEYLNNCKANNIKPHPEVIEARGVL